MKHIRKIDSLYLVRDTDHNKTNFAGSIGCSFEAPITNADCFEYPASERLTDKDFIDLSYCDDKADRHGFDAVRLAIYRDDTVMFIFSRNGTIECCYSLQTAMGFFAGLEYKPTAQVSLGTPIVRAASPTQSMPVVDDSRGIQTPDKPLPITPKPVAKPISQRRQTAAPF